MSVPPPLPPIKTPKSFASVPTAVSTIVPSFTIVPPPFKATAAAVLPEFSISPKLTTLPTPPPIEDAKAVATRRNRRSRRAIDYSAAGVEDYPTANGDDRARIGDYVRRIDAEHRSA